MCGQLLHLPGVGGGVEEESNLWEEPSEGHRHTKHEAKINYVMVIYSLPY